MYYPGMTCMVTQRCFERKMKIKPCLRVNLLILYCLLVAKLKYKIDIYSFCFMSNHFHLVLNDREGKLGDFMAWFNSQAAKSLNKFLKRKGIVWEHIPYRRQIIHTKEDLLEKIVYTIVNPVAAYLVSRIEEWPGLVSLPKDIGKKEYKAKKPQFYFKKDGRTPEETVGFVTVPECFLDEMNEQEYRNLIGSKVRSRIRDINREAQKKGRKFLGRKKVLSQSRNSVPKSPDKLTEIRPQLICSDVKLRIKILRIIKQFSDDYRSARQALLQGKVKVKFPFGTYKLKKVIGILCEHDPPWELQMLH